MALINEAAARGIEWEALLVEMLGLLHRIAMVQLSPCCTWQTTWPPLSCGCVNWRAPYRRRIFSFTYQTLLIGRKELPYAPDRRMGVEMTLLRAGVPSTYASARARSATPVLCARRANGSNDANPVPPQPQSAPQQAPTVPLRNHQPGAGGAPAVAARVQGATKVKKSGTGSRYRARPVNNAALERLASVTDRVQASGAIGAGKSASQKRSVSLEGYHSSDAAKESSPRRRR